MDKTALNTMLRNEAVKLGICEKGLKEWEEDMADAELIAFGFRNIDFLLQHHWPANDTLKSVWPKDFLRSNNVFVDDKYSVNNAERSLVLGGSNVTMRYNGWSIGVVCVRDNSELTVTAKNRSHVIIHVFDNSKVSVTQFDAAKVSVIKHSHDAVIGTDGNNIEIKEEYEYLK